MKIVEEHILHGPNLHLPVPAIVLTLEPEDWFDQISRVHLDEGVRRLNFAIKVLDNAFASARLDEAVRHEPPDLAVGELVAALALALQRQLVCPVKEARVTVGQSSRQLVIGFETRHSRLGDLAGRYACRLCAAALSVPGIEPDPLPAMIDEYHRMAEKLVPSLETRLLLQEADRRCIPWFRIGEDLPVFELGQGVMRRRFRNSLTDETGDTAYRLASFKPLAAALLQQHGVPVPAQRAVDSEDQAVAIGNRIGFPVVVKPVGQDMGVGVRIGIGNEGELRSAYRESRVHGPTQIEKHLPGFDHRFTFIRGKLVSVLCTMPPYLVGDGRSTIRHFLDADPVSTQSLARKRIIVDEEVMAHIRGAGYALEDVLPAGERIVLRKWWRSQKDHVLEDVTDSTHSDNIEAALLAVQLVGLDVAGVDYITTDITRPYHETGGAFTEVNPMPAMAGVQRCGPPAYRLLLDACFPDSDTARIATAVALGTRNDGAVFSAVDAILRRAGHTVGIATHVRLDVAGRPIRRSGIGERGRAHLILHHPRATAAILQTTADGIAAEGIALDQCDVAAILPPDAEAVAVTSRPAVNDMRSAILLGRIAQKALVIDVEDPRVQELADSAAARTILWVVAALENREPVHGRPGDATVAVRQIDGRAMIAIRQENAVHGIAPVSSAWTDGADAEARRAALTAVAIAFGMGLSPALIGEAVVAHFGAAGN